MNLPLKLKCPTNFSFHHKNLCKARERTEKPTPFTTSYYQKQLKPISVAQTQLPKTSTNTYKVEFKTLEGCKLGISSYPYFEYDAEGGAGKGIGTPVEDLSEDEIWAWFDPKEIYIPPLSSATTRFLGLPLPPFLKIEIVPEVFKGCINKQSGKVDLEFRAEFWFSVGSVYRAPALLVATVLTSEESRGETKSGSGRRLDREGSCRLVGVARVDPIDDLFINAFLQLPTECVAIINADVLWTRQALCVLRREGQDAGRVLAKLSFEEKNLNGDISSLGPFKLDVLQDWEYKFMSKYVKAGTINKLDQPSPSGPAPYLDTPAT